MVESGAVRLVFEKVHGLGNDFVLVDARGEGTTGGRGPVTPAGARFLCDRRRGVGADGVLTLLPPRIPGAAARLHIYNADGSEAEMCGNGLRCAAQRLFMDRPGPLVVETDAGPRRCEARDGLVWTALGAPRVGPSEEIDVEGERIVGRPVSMGNPHFVLLLDPASAEASDVGMLRPSGLHPSVGEAALLQQARRLGPKIERHPRFAPDRTNVEFCELGPDALRCVVWERGSGLTDACGTGAGAAAAAVIADGRWPADRTLPVDLPGGRLWVERAGDAELALVGPAECVYQGELELPV